VIDEAADPEHDAQVAVVVPLEDVAADDARVGVLGLRARHEDDRIREHLRALRDVDRGEDAAAAPRDETDGEGRESRGRGVHEGKEVTAHARAIKG
jgi:hypothetical protein